MRIIVFISLLSLLNLSKLFAYPNTADTISTTTEKIGAFDIDKVTNEYLNTLTPEQKAKSDAYFEGGYWIQLWYFIYDIAVAWIFLSLGLSRWIKKISSKNKNIKIQNLIYTALYFLFAFVLTFPFSVYTDFIREHQYQLSNMTFGGWFSEQMTTLAITIVAGSILIAILYMVIRKTKQNWWLWGSGVLILFLIVGAFIFPIFISPLFNDYKPLPEGKIKEEILSLARANGVPADNVYLFNASKQSKRISANVSGLGSTIRISLNDNLLNRCTPEEIKSVMAHELGHYVLNHVFIMIVYIGLLIIIGLAFVNWAFKKIINRYGAQWQIPNICDIGGLPLIILLFAIYLFIATPFINTMVRTHEIEADIFGLNAGREPDGAASVAMKLSEYRKINPSRFEEIIFFDHPSGKTRVYNAMRWKAEHLDEK
jgi:STE24 endopeptidase